MTFDEFVEGLQRARDERPHIGALPLSIRAVRGEWGYVIDLRHAAVERMDVDGVVHSEIAFNLTGMSKQDNRSGLSLQAESKTWPRQRANWPVETNVCGHCEQTICWGQHYRVGADGKPRHLEHADL